MVWCGLNIQRKWFLVIVFLVFMVSVWRLFTNKESLAMRWSYLWEQYNLNKTPIIPLPSDEPPSSHRSILFLEGFANDNLSSRMLCSIESAAKAHNNTDVFVMMTSPYLWVTPVTERVKGKYDNVKFVHVNASEILMNSIVKEWFLQERWKTSAWPKYHFNDVLRWALLWKYGGIFMDMDVVILKDLLQEEKNFSSLQSDAVLGMAVLGFSKEHPVIEECLRWLNDHFNGSVWAANGPGVLTKVLVDQCGLDLPSRNMTKCDDIKVYPPRAFNPIPWQNWSKYAEANETLANELIHDPDVFALHTWNVLLHGRPIVLSESSPYAVAARSACPTVVSEVGDTL